MERELGENAPQKPPALVVGQPLPPSGLERELVDVKRNYVVIHATVPPHLEDLASSDWKSASKVKKAFLHPKKGRQKKGAECSKKFPYCLFVHGPAKESKRERLIIVNWWLQLTDEEREAVWKRLKKTFVSPTVSAKMFTRYDPLNPKVTGIADVHSRRVKHANNTTSKQIANGGAKSRKTVMDPARTNAQLRDVVVKQPEANAQQQLARCIKRSRVETPDKEDVTAFFEPHLMTSSTAFTPVRRGNPCQDVRPDPNVKHFARSREGLKRAVEPLVSALLANPNVKSLENVSAETLVESLEAAGNHSLYYADDSENWPGMRFIANNESSNVRTVGDTLAQQRQQSVTPTSATRSK